MKIRSSVCIALFLATVAPAQESPAPGSVTARTLARSALLGFKLAIEDGTAGKPAAARMLECVRALDETPLVGVLQTLLASDMTQAENAELDRFFSSVPGQKYERLGQLAIYTSNGKPAPEPNPEFSPAESAALDAFSKTTAGRKYLFERWVEEPSVQAALQERLQGLYRDCRSKT